MSSIYATEPATSGRVIMETTHGPLEIQLWCRECPTATKLFLQLCLDGYYDNMLFHRIVSDFLIQTGALRQGKKQAAGFSKDYQNKIAAPSALERRKYETHSRLRFNHRGQLAMALGVDDEDDEELQPQFFITLEEAPYLDGKHVLFGTCAGPTIFNALRIGKMAVDDNHQPVDLEHAPRVKSVKIVENPIHTDIAPQASVPWRAVKEESKIAKKKKKRKGKKDLNVLSFGDELEMGEEGGDAGIKSSHDLVSSKTLSKSVDEKVMESITANDEEKLQSKNSRSRGDSEADNSKQEEKKADNASPVSEPVTSEKRTEKPPVELERPPVDSQEKKQKQPKVSLVEARLARFKGKASKNKRQREEDTMAKLGAFKTKVRKQAAEGKSQAGADDIKDNSLAARMARKAQGASASSTTSDNGGGETYHGQVLEDNNEEDGDWMGTRFKCRRHMDHSSRQKGGDGRDMNDYEVIDEKNRSDHRKRSDGRRRRR